MLRRREFLRASVIGAGALAFGPAFWRNALAAPATAGPGPYGPLQPADANGIMLPAGFRSRAIAQGGQIVPGTSYEWHVFSDGQATYRTEDGGFILVSNSENPPDLGVVTPGSGGASAIRFRADGSIVDAYRILSGTSVNCAGGATPWGTWLSCEEHEEGQVWECDPTGRTPGVARPAMGIFEHEAVAVDPDGRCVYLSEDNASGGFYRFTPQSYPDLSAGTLEVAKVGPGGLVDWARVPDASAGSAPTRAQVAGMTRFNRGEGMWFDSGTV
jgi:secreted PhoX family phosphatase